MRGGEEERGERGGEREERGGERERERERLFKLCVSQS